MESLNLNYVEWLRVSFTFYMLFSLPGVDLTRGIIREVQHPPHPDHHHTQPGVAGGGLQGAALSRAQYLLRAGLNEENIVLAE